MDSFRTKLILAPIVFGFIIGTLLGTLLYFQFPAYYSNWYIGALLFYLIVEPLIMVYVESSSRKAKANPLKLSNVYMLTKVIKIVAALVFIGIYALIAKEGLKHFALIFVALYLLFLALESYLFLKIEKRLKQQQN